jgi:hypothetical protein
LWSKVIIMDVGANIRQPAQPILTGQTNQPATLKSAVETGLPIPLAVSALTASEPVKVDLDPSAERRARLEAEIVNRRKQFSIDAASREVITQTVNAGTGQVINQYPDDWQLKQQAYSRAVIEQQLEAQTTVDRSGGFVPVVSVQA